MYVNFSSSALFTHTVEGFENNRNICEKLMCFIFNIHYHTSRFCLDPWFVLWSFYPLRLPCISTNLPHCFVWNIVVMYGLVPVEMLDKLQRICRTVGPSLAASLKPLVHLRNAASLSLFYRYYFGRCSSELTQLVPLPYSRGSSTRYSDRFIIFLSPFLDVTRMSTLPVSFLA